MRRVLAVLALAFVASLLAPGPTAALGRVDLGDPAPSAVEALPVPEVAVIDPELHTDDGVGTVSETYRLPEGTKAKALRRWYKKELPIGQAFGDWSWCESVKTRIVLQRTWARDGANLILLLRFERNAPPSILVGTVQPAFTDGDPSGCERER